MIRPPDNVRRQQERFTDNLIQSSFSYWSAILTVNGLILAFFSADILKGEFALNWLIIILLFLTVISIVLILFNFRGIRDLYFDLGSITLEDFRNMSEEEKQVAYQQKPSGFKWRKIREGTIEILLLIEVALILFIVVYSKYFLS